MKYRLNCRYRWEKWRCVCSFFTYLRSMSLGFLATYCCTKSCSRHFMTSVKYSSLSWRAMVSRLATYPRSLWEKPCWASRVWMNWNRDRNLTSPTGPGFSWSETKLHQRHMTPFFSLSQHPPWWERVCCWAGCWAAGDLALPSASWTLAGPAGGSTVPFAGRGRRLSLHMSCNLAGGVLVLQHHYSSPSSQSSGLQK